MLKISKPFFQWILLAICLVWAIFYILILSQTTFSVSVRLKSLDTLYAIRNAHSKPLPHFKDVVIIGVDDESCRKMGLAWPWGRDIFAVFLDRLQELNPKVVALDFSFVGESSDPEADKKLSSSLSNKKNTILTAYFDGDDQYVLPLKSFRQAALSYGFVDKPLDHDLVNRHVNPAVVLENGNTYSMALEIAFVSLNLSPKNRVEIRDDGLVINEKMVSLDNQEQMWLSYRYKPSDFTYVPFWKIYEGQTDPSMIRGKTVIVGPTSPAFRDMSSTPLGKMAGVFVNANEALCYMDADYIRELFLGWQWALPILIAGALAFALYTLSYLQGFVVLVLIEILIYSAAVVLFQGFNLIFEPFSPMFISGCVYGISILFRVLATFLENEMLKKQAVTDNLTGLYGHRYLSLRLETEFSRAREVKSNFCFIMIDVDDFKKVNDTYGHEVGNTVLVMIGKLLKNGIRGYDLAARYGGEEFSLVLFRIEEIIAFQTIERIRSTIAAQKIYSPKGEFSVSISAGICSSNNPDVRSKDDLIRLADQALYEAKTKGRNQTCVYKTPAVTA